MREKIYNVLNKIYGTILIVAFFAGLLPLVPFIIALIIGGPTGEAISVFLYNEYYPWVIAASAISVLVGWIALYFLKDDKASKKKNKDKNKDKNKEEEASEHNIEADSQNVESPTENTTQNHEK